MNHGKKTSSPGKPPHHPHHASQNKTQQDASRKGEIKPKILPLNHDVAGQFPQEGDRGGENPHQSDDGDQHADDDKEPAGVVQWGLSFDPFTSL